MTSFDLQAYLGTRREMVNAALDRALPATDAAGTDAGRLREGMRYGVLQGGKRMRPLLTLAACEAVGGAAEVALPPACALELIHAYSLVHDDLPAMDNDLERRGKPTVHVAFGEANAILIGDALLTAAFSVLTSAERDPAPGAIAFAVSRLAHHAGIDGMVGGQAKDLALGQDIEELATLEDVHALKTGALYAAAGAMGARFGGASPEVVDRLERYGLAWGIAFQHADDVLDDDQPRLRDQAMARTDALLAECRGIARELGEPATALLALADWLGDRASRAIAGEDQA